MICVSALRFALEWIVVASLFAVLLLTPASWAAEHVVRSSAHEGYRQEASQCKDDQQRAGYPQKVAWWAKHSETKHHSYGWVGGGTLGPHGDAPCQNEGTWARDYHLFPMDWVWLKWSHGRRYQGGPGAYKGDGPKLHLHK